VAARYARVCLGFDRVVIIDFDVHHGNGTQAAFWDDPSVLFMSIQRPFWPHSGAVEEDGGREGKGYTVNCLLPEGSADPAHIEAMDRLVVPIARDYLRATSGRKLVLVSAGYDAHQDDPLGGQRVSTAGFALITMAIREICQATGAKPVFFLEGGYNPEALAASVVATVRVLSGCDGSVRLTPLTQDANPASVEEHLGHARRHHSRYWPCLRAA
jgi:acetoin utilization deacetylase AcuC-like enzyme